MHRFQPHTNSENVIRVMRAVAYGENIGIGCPTVIVDDDAIVNVKSGIRRQFSIWHNADSDHDQVCCNLVSIARSTAATCPSPLNPEMPVDNLSFTP